MTGFIQVVIDGFATGSIYATLATALVLVFRTTGLINFAQGEMAMFSTFIAWTAVQIGLPLIVAVLVMFVLSFAMGVLTEVTLIRRMERRGDLQVVIVTLGLFLALNAAAGWIWGFNSRSMPSLFPSGVIEVAGVRVAKESLGITLMLIALVAIAFVILEKTRMGLAVRAASANRRSTELAGVNVSRIISVNWGIGAALGGLSGVLIAPNLLLDNNLMNGVIVYAFAAAALGGFDSLPGAVVGGWVIGICENLGANYVGFIGADLKILVPLVIIVVILLARPTGLFGSQQVLRA